MPGRDFTRDTSSAQTFKNYKKYSRVIVLHTSIIGLDGGWAPELSIGLEDRIEPRDGRRESHELTSE